MRTIFKSIVVVFMSLIVTLSGFGGKSSAVDLLNRSVTIGTSVPSATTSYDFRFDIGTVANVGSIVIDFCQTSPLFSVTCVFPSGFNASGANLASQTGETGFSISPLSTANQIILTRVPSLTSLTTATYRFTGIVSHDYVGTGFIRLSTYASIDGTGSRIDSGGLAYSTANRLSTNAYVPPYLTFCVGVTVAGDCSSASGQFIGFGELSSTQSRSVTSQYAGATNDPGGYSTTVTGITMTSGTKTIPALSSPTASIAGTSQFGMNLRANTSPSTGNNPSGIGTSIVAPDYNQVNFYTFKNQVTSYSTTSTDFNLFTVSYVVNVSQNQSPGIYNTTLTYIATAAF